jgi:hypothetical protein
LAPCDFDLSPYFKIVKPGLKNNFDHRDLVWADALASGPAELGRSGDLRKPETKAIEVTENASPIDLNSSTLLQRGVGVEKVEALDHGGSVCCLMSASGCSRLRRGNDEVRPTRRGSPASGAISTMTPSSS